MNQVVVTTAVKLSAEQQVAVKQTVSEKLGKAKFELQEMVDPAVIGGVRLQINSRVYDATIAGKLSALKRNAQ